MTIVESTSYTTDGTATPGSAGEDRPTVEAWISAAKMELIGYRAYATVMRTNLSNEIAEGLNLDRDQTRAVIDAFMQGFKPMRESPVNRSEAIECENRLGDALRLLDESPEHFPDGDPNLDPYGDFGREALLRFAITSAKDVLTQELWG